MNIEKKKFVIRVNSNSTIGTGHLMRCLTLANHLKKLKFSVIFVTNHLEKNSHNLIKENGFKIYSINDSKKDNLSNTKDANLTKQILISKKINSPYLIVDNYDF